MAVFSGFKEKGHSSLKQYWDRHLEKTLMDLKTFWVKAYLPKKNLI